jgi:Mn-containing catalase
MTREITPVKAFTAALESLNKPRFMIGRIPPTAKLVDQSFNTSTAEGEDGEIDARGPERRRRPGVRRRASVSGLGRRQRRGYGRRGMDGGVDDRTISTAQEPQMIEELLIDHLRDLLHAEGQLVKALPKMAKAARSETLRMAFETHLDDTKLQMERLKEVFDLMGVEGKAKPCKGMAGLIEEGEDVISEHDGQEDAAADLALIAAAQKVEHYEISAYGTARTMAGQAGLPGVAELLNKSLAEEKLTDNLLTQFARELMSESRTGLTKAPKHTVTAGEEQ